MAQIPPMAWFWMRWYSYWQKGLVPVAGGLLDQPAKYLEVMEFIDLMRAKKEKDRADKRRTGFDS